MVIKRIDPVSCAKITGTLYLILGFIIGGVVSIFALLGGLVGRGSITGNNTALIGSALVGVGSILIFPVIYGVIGSVGALIAAALYNVLARFVGGIRIEVEAEPLSSAGRLQSGSALDQLAQRTDDPAQ